MLRHVCCKYLERNKRINHLKKCFVLFLIKKCRLFYWLLRNLWTQNQMVLSRKPKFCLWIHYRSFGPICHQCPNAFILIILRIWQNNWRKIWSFLVHYHQFSRKFPAVIVKCQTWTSVWKQLETGLYTFQKGIHGYQNWKEPTIHVWTKYNTTSSNNL